MSIIKTTNLRWQKISFLVLAVTLTISAMLSIEISAQSKKTIILVRHAEKDLSPGSSKTDPDLSAQGYARAERLALLIKKYKPGAVYSSDFIRTRNTARPTAKRRKKDVQKYDHRDLNALADEIMGSKTKRFLVVGHNSTTPALANILIGEDHYQTLAESEYGKIWIIKFSKGKLRSAEVIDY